MLNNTLKYLEERKKWKNAGSPTRTKERIEELFNICSSNECGKYEGFSETNGKCGECGCFLSKLETAAFNKLAWSTTRCPLSEPKWIEEETIEEAESRITQETPVEEQSTPPRKIGGCGCGG